MNPCKFNAYLTAYVLRDMDQKRFEAMDVHVHSCPECQKQAAALRDTLSLLKEAFPTEKAQTGKAPVLAPERRQQLLTIKALPKQSAFMHFINKAYRPLRMIAATLICVFGLLVILSASLNQFIGMFSTAGKGATGESLGSRGGGSDGYAPRSSSDKAKFASKAARERDMGFAAVVDEDVQHATTLGRQVKEIALPASGNGTASLLTDADKDELRDLDKRMDAPAGPASRALVKAGEKLGDDAGWLSKKSVVSEKTKAKHRERVDYERYDDGLEANQPVSAPAAAPEPAAPVALDGVAVAKSPVALHSVYGSSRRGSDQLSLKREVSSPEGAAATVPAETAPRPPAPATPMPTAERFARDKEVAAPENSVSSTRRYYGLAVAQSGPGRVSGGAAVEEAPRQMETLKIQPAKPAFTGTPKDIRSANLEKPGERENKPADYPVVSYERTAESKLEPDSKFQKLGIGGSVNGETIVNAGTLITGKRDSKLAESPQKEEEGRKQVITLSGGIVKSDTWDFKGSSLGHKNEVKKAVAEDAVNLFAYSDVTKAKDESRTWADLSGQDQKLEKKLEEFVEAADLRKKPSPPREPLPFNSFVLAAAEPFSTFAMDVDTAGYTLTRQALRSGKLPDPERVRLEEIVNAFDYADMAPDRATFRVYQDGAQSPFGAGYNLLRIGVKGRRLGREEQRPAMLTFVIDVSGSMSQPDRIGFARQALSSLLDQVGSGDRIQIIAYSDQAQFVLPPSPATEKARIMAAFDRLQCNGSTNLEEGLRRAYEQAGQAFIPGAENRVILISDGVANLGADSAQEILNKVAANRKQGITCSVFGVGSGTYNDKMLQDLANKGDGVYRFLDSAEEVKTAFVDDLAATLNFIAKDAKIQVEWNPKTVKRYRQMGYEKRKLTKEQFRDDTVDAGEVGSGQSVTALYELELMPDVTPESSLGTVRIRYQRTDNGKIEEIESALVASTVLRPAHNASVHFKVAASAAEFAELLRGSPHAQDGRFERVADYLRPAALERSLDTRIKELLELVTTAASLTK